MRQLDLKKRRQNSLLGTTGHWQDTTVMEIWDPTPTFWGT